MRFLGDVHGDYEEYRFLIEGVEKSIQLGDMGIGFAPFPIIPPSHRFIRGNHDNPFVCKTIPNWIPDGTYEDGMFFLGGGYSIDWAWRVPGKSWWSEEELTIVELQELIDKYGDLKPRLVASHECPTVMALSMSFFSHHAYDSSRTSQAMDAMFKIHKPELWLFGHYHQTFENTIDGTRFICLGEHDFIDL